MHRLLLVAAALLTLSGSSPAQMAGVPPQSQPATQAQTTSQTATQAAAQTAAPAKRQAPKPAAEAAPGGGPDKVWVNLNSSVYHCPGDRYYGKTANGRYMTEAAAKSAGAKGTGGKTCFAK